MAATTDVFGNSVDFGTGFKAALATCTFASVKGTDPGLGVLVQNVQAQYQQQVTRVWELASSKTYYIAGRSLGQMSIARIVGPQSVQSDFVTQFGDVCKATANTFDINPKAGVCPPNSTANMGRRFHNCVITSVGMSMQAQDMVINENMQLMFAAMGPIS